MITSPIHLAITLAFVGAIFWLLLYLIEVVPIPEPFPRMAHVAILVIGVLIVILVLLDFLRAIDVGALYLAR